MRIELVIKRKPETDEWLVVWMENGRRNENKTTYESSKEAALETRAFLADRLRKAGFQAVELGERKHIWEQ